MKYNTKCKRIMIMVFVTVLILPCLLLPVVAIGEEAPTNVYNYVELIKSYKIIDADTVQVYLEIPSSRLSYRPYKPNGSSYVNGYDKVVIKYPGNVVEMNYDISASIFGGPIKNGLWLGNIPNNTYMSLDFSMKLNNEYSGEAMTILGYDRKFCTAVYSKGDNQNVEEIQVENLDTLQFGMQLTKTGDYDKVLFRCVIAGLRFPPADVVYTLENLTFTMKISALEMEAIQDQKTQGLLDDVNKNLEAVQANQKKYGDEILYGENLDDHNVNGPGGFNDTMEQQHEQVQNGMEEINKVPKPDADTAIPDIQAQVPSEGMTLMSNIMGGITGFTIVPIYLLIVVGLFIVSFIMFGKKES